MKELRARHEETTKFSRTNREIPLSAAMMPLKSRNDPDPAASTRYAFGDFVLDLRLGSLQGPDGELPLRPKAYAVLTYLVARPGELVSKNALLHAVWDRVVVTDDSLTQCIVEIRRALGEHGAGLIRTVPRRGYVFTGDVATEATEHVAPDSTKTPGICDNTSSPVTSRGVWRRYAWRGLFAALVLVVLASVDWSTVVIPLSDPLAAPGIGTTPGDSEIPSVAVLPFTDMSPASDHGYFGDGVAEEILNRLAKVPGVRVIARTSSFALRDAGLDVPALGRRLGVTHLLEGSVRPAGERARIVAHLVDARDGVQLWSGAYEMKLEDSLAVQDDIALKVTALLHANLAQSDTQAAPSGRTVGARALEHYLRGLSLFGRRAPGDLDTAVDHFEAAVALEPGYAEAWVGLVAARWILLARDGTADAREWSALHDAAMRAVELGPGLPEAHLRAASIYRAERNVIAAERHVRIARELDPNHPLLLQLEGGRALAAGRLDEAIDYKLRALSRDPLSLALRHNLGHLLLAAGRIAEARAQLEAIRELAGVETERGNLLELTLLLREGQYAEAWAIAQSGPTVDEWLVRKAMALHALGRKEEALRVIDGLRTSESPQAAFALAEFHAWLEDTQTAAYFLEQAQARWGRVQPLPDSPSWLQRVALSPFLGALRSSEREIKSHA